MGKQATQVGEIAANVVLRSVQGSSGEADVVFKDLYKEGPVAVVLLRRFGCALCRNASLKFDAYKEDFDKVGVRVVGVGLEKLGLEEFVEGKYWNSDLMIDESKALYNDLGCKRNTIWNGFGMFNSGFWKGVKESKNVDGNLQGDGWQMGGAFVIDKEGKFLYSFRQSNYGEHADPIAMLKALGVESPVERSTERQEAVCDNDVCTRPVSK
eukprot:Nk52_evm97s485 gene=Nk52_evmTU97s485